MKIGCISDIHVDINQNYKVVEDLAAVIKEKELDYLIIAGDIYNDYTVCMEVIERIKKLSGIEVYFVPGNHDLRYGEKKDNNTFEIYNRYVENPSCLCGKSKQISEDWVIIGDIGWYDYSFGSSKYEKKDFEKMRAFDRTWEDSIYVHWGKSNEEMTEFFVENLQEQFELNKDKKKIAVMHMVPRREFSVTEKNELWEYFNAFLGSRKYAELFERYKTEYVVLGHVHYRKYEKFNNTKYICSCLSYSSQWQKPENSVEEIRNTLYVIEVF